VKTGDETEKAYREKLKDVRGIVKAAKVLMRSEEESVRLQAIDIFIQLSEFELALVQALSEEPETRARVEEDRNPLVRRARLGR
jgi:hypothetical protein